MNLVQLTKRGKWHAIEPGTTVVPACSGDGTPGPVEEIKDIDLVDSTDRCMQTACVRARTRR